MLVSLLTPTFEREGDLRVLYQTLLAQKLQEWEWLICDDSFCPSPFFRKVQDARVKYHYVDETMSIGAKRNYLKARAQGEILVHIDDDDYYAPDYLLTVREQLKTADFFTFTSWFCYHRRTNTFYYWDTGQLQNKHFHLSPLSEEVTTLEFGQQWRNSHEATFKEKTQTGYGFTYAYLKEVAAAVDFEPVDFGEDALFFEQVKSQGWRIKMIDEKQGLVLHVIHDKNASWVAPQYQIDETNAKKLFPGFGIFSKKD